MPQKEFCLTDRECPCGISFSIITETTEVYSPEYEITGLLPPSYALFGAF